MFEKGDYVIYGNNGICRVQDITTLSISGIDKNRKYYLLKPVYSSGSTVYTPVDTAETLLRPALSREEADSLIRSIPDIPLIPIADEKTLEKTYKEYMRSNSLTAAISVSLRAPCTASWPLRWTNPGRRSSPISQAASTPFPPGPEPIKTGLYPVYYKIFRSSITE